MMLPYLKEVQNASKQYSLMFKGINYGEGTQDGEFADTLNLSTSKYPCITQRAARIKVNEEPYENPTTIHAKGKLLIIDGTKVFYDGKEVGTVTEGKKQTATVGNYVVIFPDKKYYKVPTEEEEGEFDSMEAEYTHKGLVFTSSGISAVITYKSAYTEFAPEFFGNATIWFGKKQNYTGCTFTSSTIERNNGFSSIGAGDRLTIVGCKATGNNKEGIIVKGTESGKLIFEEGTFEPGTESGMIYIVKSDGGIPFEVGDTVNITGADNPSSNLTNAVINEVTDCTITFEDAAFIRKDQYGEGKEVTIKLTKAKGEFPFEKGDNIKITGCSAEENNKEIVVREVRDGELIFDENSFTAGVELSEATLKREVPDLDFICENNYRLWGVHENTIYSSKYSDPMNFASFEGLTGDSYAIDVASEGGFTGCIPYSTHICFFKENVLHKLYGDKPSNFRIVNSNVYGVQSGSEKSMQIVNEQLIYKGVGGVYMYNGGVPELISEKFGNNRYSEAVACCDGEIYYISMKQGNEWHLFAYDVLKNIWLREDGTNASDMTFHDGKVYYLDADTRNMYYIDKTADRSDIEWGATFCTIHETINERKGYSKFHLRLDLSAGAWLSVDIKTDSDNVWRQVYTTHNAKAKTITVPIMPTRCDSIDIRLRGKGECTVKAFIREFTAGSDI